MYVLKHVPLDGVNNFAGHQDLLHSPNVTLDFDDVKNASALGVYKKQPHDEERTDVNISPSTQHGIFTTLKWRRRWNYL